MPIGHFRYTYFSLPAPAPPAVGGDLLGALYAYLLATPSVASAFTPGFGEGYFGRIAPGTTKIYETEADPNVLPPYLLIESYEEVQPGETLEDMPVNLTLSIVSLDLDQARTLSQAVRNAVDSPNINAASIRTQPFVWTGGSEQGVMRNPSKPYRVKGASKLTQGYVYREDIDYEFWVDQVSG